MTTFSAPTIDALTAQITEWYARQGSVVTVDASPESGDWMYRLILRSDDETATVTAQRSGPGINDLRTAYGAGSHIPQMLRRAGDNLCVSIRSADWLTTERRAQLRREGYAV